MNTCTCICYMYHDDDKRYKQPNLQFMGTGNNIKKLAIAITNYNTKYKIVSNQFFT